MQLKRAEQEITIKLTEAMRRAEDPVQRQRAVVEEDRHKYLGLEERVLVQLRYDYKIKLNTSHILISDKVYILFTVF